ncbi:MAG: YafY family protein [Clostridiales bacterium]|nr:YafY family transcriptional regulator [Roseburia sp.]MDD7636706.1 YafY family protein [Clostridiales bacterium]MDY4111687.1 YafY family protein [Roseburia sp.]
MKEGRLFQILYYLLEKGHATAPELAARFEVSNRTIYRDIDALSASGIPIYAEKGRNGGIFLLHDHVLERAVFSDAEKQTLLEALQNLAAVGGAGDEVIKKLSALFCMEAENWLEIDFTRWGKTPGEQQKFDMLKEAIFEHCIVKITYVGTKGIETTRKIQPIQMLCKMGNWYVKAYCMKKEEFRTFKISRITELTLLPETFLPKSYPQTENQNSQNDVTLRDMVFCFSDSAAYRVYDEFDSDQIERQKDGSLLVRTKMPEDVWLTGYLLSFGTEVEVIEPAYLRDLLAKQAKRIYEKNKIQPNQISAMNHKT